MSLLLIPLIPLCVDPICKITSSAQGIYSLMNSISSYSSDKLIIDELKKMDIMNTLRIYEKIISELSVTNKTESYDITITSINECLEEIELELTKIYNKLEYNNKIYFFHSARSYKLSSSINELKRLQSQLNNRISILSFILNNSKYLISKKNESIIDMSIIDKKKLIN
jgi:hypothetical protein